MSSEQESAHYDLELHKETVCELLGISPDHYAMTTVPLKPDQEAWIDELFSEPQKLRLALVDASCEFLQTTIWPNQLTGQRKVPVNYPEIEEAINGTDVQGEESPLPPVYSGPSRLNLGPCQGLMTESGIVHQVFIGKAIDLINRLETNPEEMKQREWPLSLLFAMVCLAKFSEADEISLDPPDKQSLSKTNPDDSEPRDLILEFMENTLRNSNSLDNSLSLRVWNGLGFLDKNLLDRLMSLNSSIEDDPQDIWLLGLADYQIQQACLKRGDLTYEEWIATMRLSNRAADKTRWLLYDWGNQHCGIWGSGSVIGVEGPIHHRTYWAWRTGFSIASGVHLKEELSGANFNDEEFFNNGIPLALDLTASIGAVNDWDGLREYYYERIIWFRNNSAEYEDVYDDYVGDAPVLNMYGPGSAISWLVKIGYVDGMLARTSNEHQSLEADLDRLWSDPASDLKDSVKTAVESVLGTKLEEIIGALSTSNKVSSSAYSYESQIFELVGTDLWTALGPDARLELIESERLFNEQNQPEWYYVASQHYCNTAETLLNHWLRGRVKKLYENTSRPSNNRDLPRYIGDWGYHLGAHILEMADWEITGWPELDRTLVIKLKETCDDLAKHRKVSHPGISSISVHETRNLFFGTYVGDPHEGLLELAGKLSGKPIKSAD